MTLKITVNGKLRRLKPTKRLGKGDIVNVLIDGVPTEGVMDKSHTHTFINVRDVEYYVSTALVEGTEYISCEIDPGEEAKKREEAREAKRQENEAAKAARAEERAAAREAKAKEKAEKKAAEAPAGVEGEAVSPARSRGRKAESAGEGAAAQASA